MTRIRTLMDDMLTTMYAAPGMVWAAIQVGVQSVLSVMESGPRPAKPRTRNNYVNPNP